MKALLVTLALSTTMAAHADILVMGYDQENKALVALTNTECKGVKGKVAGVRLEDKRTFLGCWTGEGNTVRIYFPETNKSVEYDVRMFHIVNNELVPLEGGITATI